MKQLIMVLVCCLILIVTGCSVSNKEINVKVSDNCIFSKNLVLEQDGTNYYVSCIDDVQVKYNGNIEKTVSLFDDIRNGKTTIDEVYDRSVSINKDNGVTIFNFDEYYILECQNNFVFGNLKNGIDKRYCMLETDEIISLNKLSKEYNYKDAIKDNYYVVTDKKHYNDEVMQKFLDSIISTKTAFIRIVNSSYDGKIVITDVLYDKERVTVFVDDTRNLNDEASIKIYEFTHLDVIDDEVGKYLYAYNGNVINENPDSMDSFLIAKIG